MEPSSKGSAAARRRQREKEERSRTILEAAERLFAEQGFHQTSLEQIGELAEVAPATVYFYFKNKEDLLVTLMRDIGQELRCLMGRAFQEADPSLDGLRRAGERFFHDFCLPHPGKVSIFFRESVGQSAALDAERRMLFEKLITDVKQALVRVWTENTGRPCPELRAEVAAACIFGMFERVACHFLLWQDRGDEADDIAREVVGFTLGGVRDLLAET